MTEKSVKFFIASVALSTTLGVFMHDSHIDRATMTALGKGLVSDDRTKSKLQAELHTHSTHARVSKNPANANAPDPRDKIKNREQKKLPGKFARSGQSLFVQPA